MESENLFSKQNTLSFIKKSGEKFIIMRQKKNSKKIQNDVDF